MKMISWLVLILSSATLVLVLIQTMTTKERPMMSIRSTAKKIPTSRPRKTVMRMMANEKMRTLLLAAGTLMETNTSRKKKNLKLQLQTNQ
jgi:hypothetical protein